MARPASPTRRSRLKRTGPRMPSSASRSANAILLSACRPDSYRSTAPWRCSPERATTRLPARISASCVPEQPGGANEKDGADGEDDRPRPLAKSVIGHALDHERRKRGPADRQQDRRSGRPERDIADAGERSEIERAHDVAERLG